MKLFKALLCVLLVGTLFTGCMSSTHLKDLYVVEGIGVDVKDSFVNVTVQTLNVSNVSGGGSELPQKNATILSQQQGENIIDAISSFPKALSKELFYGQNKIIVFGNDIVKKGFEDKLDYFFRSTDSRADVAICISQTTANDILQSTENDSRVPCENILYLLKNSEEAGAGAYVTTSELLNMYKDKTTDMYLPVLKLKKDKKNVYCTGVGIFNDDRLVYVLNDRELKGFLFATGKIENCYIEFEEARLGKIGAEISAVSIKRRVEISNGDVHYITKIKCDIILNEIENGIVTQLSNEDIERICSKAENEIQETCVNAFIRCQNKKSDCFRVGEYLSMASPKSYEKLSKDWDYYFKTVKPDFSAKCELKKIRDNIQVK